jgi:hypothetical protein
LYLLKIYTPLSNPSLPSPNLPYNQKNKKQNHESSLIGQAVDLFFNNHEFESLQGHWRLTWSLTSGPVRLVAHKLTQTLTLIKKNTANDNYN